MTYKQLLFLSSDFLLYLIVPISPCASSDIFTDFLFLRCTKLNTLLEFLPLDTFGCLGPSLHSVISLNQFLREIFSNTQIKINFFHSPCHIKSWMFDTLLLMFCLFIYRVSSSLSAGIKSLLLNIILIKF